MKHADIIQTLNLEQKCALLSGETVFTTRALPGKGIPAITLSDGPNGVRKQAGAADHLGLNPSVPATCFPTSSATACSWDEKLAIARECGIDKQLSFHLARHTYATTICLSNGVSLETLSKMLGHKNITTTQIYAKVTPPMIDREVTMLREKLATKFSV